MSDEITSINDLIQKIERLTEKGEVVDPAFVLSVMVLESGYILKWTKGTRVFDLEYRPRLEAIEDKKDLIKRIQEVLEEK